MFQQEASFEQPHVYKQQMRGFLERRPCSNQLHPISSVFSEPAAVPQKNPLLFELCRHGFYSTVLMCISVGTLGWDATESNGAVRGVIKVQHVVDNHRLRGKKFNYYIQICSEIIQPIRLYQEYNSNIIIIGTVCCTAYQP